MDGRGSRRKGAYKEVQVVNWMRGRGSPDARRYLAGDGRQPGDIDALPGICLEVKARAECKPGTWMTQAELEAGSRLAVVVYHPPGVADVGEWVGMVRFRQLLHLLED